MSTPKTHTAIAATALGTVAAITVPTPVAGKGQLLVRIEFSCVGVPDTYIVDGKFPVPFPATLGLNAVGKVVQVGEDVQGFTVGDEVNGIRGIPRRSTFTNYSECRSHPLVSLVKRGRCSNTVSTQPNSAPRFVNLVAALA